mmetsp:Transcript_40596/g.121084  ORF Transcript_40596/g.121084 Transcript_40596/m.121084 type:complete len:768 (+) Transcript_40596:932-3235(+)
MELLLCMHSLLLLLLLQLLNEHRGLFIFEPPAVLRPSLNGEDLGLVWMRRLLYSGGALLLLAVLLPLIDGSLLYEALGNLLFAGVAGGAALTHALMMGETPTGLASGLLASRRAVLVATVACSMACGVCYALALKPPGSLRLRDDGLLPPVQYMLLQVCAAFAALHAPPLAFLAEVWYTGRSAFGLEAEDAPRDRHGRSVGACRLLLAALACALLAGGLGATAGISVSLDRGAHVGGGALPQTEHYDDAERCQIYWGLSGTEPCQEPRREGDVCAMDHEGVQTRVAPKHGFRPETAAAQEELLRACWAIHHLAPPPPPRTPPLPPFGASGGLGGGGRGGAAAVAYPYSPLHSESPQHSGDHRCVMSEFHAWVLEAGQRWPVPEDQFAASLKEFLGSAPYELQRLVGFDRSMRRVTWMAVQELPAKFAKRDSVKLLADPALLQAYRAQWDLWFESLPRYVRSKKGTSDPVAVAAATRSNSTLSPAKIAAAIGHSSLPLPDESESVLRLGVHTCSKWTVLAVERAFFDSVSRALVATPLVSMGAIAVFARSLVVAYAAFYSLLGMLLALLGVMHLLGIPLGVTSALALALVLGMAVDYLIHLAHAYRHSLFTDRYHKSRAAVFARGQSIVSSAITTFGAVLPLLWAQLLPLRQFGRVFALVAIIAFGFAFCFLAFLMVFGPLHTRRRASAGAGGAVPPHGSSRASPYPTGDPSLGGSHATGGGGRGYGKLEDEAVDLDGGHSEDNGLNESRRAGGAGPRQRAEPEDELL